MLHDSEQLKGEGLSILIVDDEPSIRFLVGEALKEEGRKIYMAGSGKQAIALLEQVVIDIILLDLNMPGLSGVDVFRILQQKNFQGSVVLMTASEEGELIDEAKALGIKRFLIKPFDLDDLIQIVKK